MDTISSVCMMPIKTDRNPANIRPIPNALRLSIYHEEVDRVLAAQVSCHGDSSVFV